MASTYSTNLALDLMANGDQSGTWGTTNNTNLGTLIEQAISGYVTQAITDGSGANTTITIPNGATGVARNMYIEMTGALTFSTTSLIVPANKKMYFIFNNTTGGFAVTVKVSGQTGILVPNGKKVILTSNGTDIVEAANQVVGAFGVGGTATMAAINATTFTTSGRVSLGNASNSTASGPTLKIDGSGSGSDQIAIYEASADKWHINSSTGVLGLYNVATSSYAATISAANVFAVAGAATVGTTLGVSGTSTMAAINYSGRLSQALSPVAAEYALRSTGQTTGWIAVEMANTGGSYIIAGENSSGNNLITGDSAYDLVVRGPSGIAFSANAGSAMQMRIASTGAVTIPGTTTIGAASAGVGTLTINNAVQPTIYLAKTNATATTWQIYNNGNLGFSDGTNTPLYFVGANSIFGGKLTAQVSGMNAAIALGQVSDGTGYGTVTLNNAFAKDTLLGLRGNATGVDPTLFLNAPSGGSIEMRIANGGSVVSVSSTALAVGSTFNLLVNGAAANGVFAILGRSGLSTMYVQRSNTAQSFGVEDDGNVYAGQIGASTGTALILSGGYIKTLTSSRRYKKDEEPIDIGLDFINTLKPIKFRLKENDLPQVGFIAEDFPDERLVDMSYIDIENKELGMRPESVHYSQITAPLVKAVQELSAKVAALEAAR